MPNSFKHAIIEFCELIKLSDADAIANGGAFDVNGTTFSISRLHINDKDICIVFADFGSIFEFGENQHKLFLESNFTEFISTNSCFSISPLTGSIIYSRKIFPQGSNSKHLLHNIIKIADMADKLRKNGQLIY